MAPIPWVPTVHAEGNITTAITCTRNLRNGHIVNTKVSKTQRIVPLQVLRLDFSTDLLSISQIGETAPLTSWFTQVANFAEDGSEEGEPMRE